MTCHDRHDRTAGLVVMVVHCILTAIMCPIMFSVVVVVEEAIGDGHITHLNL